MNKRDPFNNEEQNRFLHTKQPIFKADVGKKYEDTNIYAKPKEIDLNGEIERLKRIINEYEAASFLDAAQRLDLNKYKLELKELLKN